MLDIHIPVHSILKMRQYILFVIVFLSSVCVMVFPVDEGWLLDPIFNTYNNLSLGQFLNNRLNFDQFMVNPDLYEYFVVSEEPLNDRDSRISNSIAGGTRVDIVPNDTIVGGAQINSP